MKNQPNKIPVFMYHAVCFDDRINESAATQYPYVIPLTDFRAQITFMVEHKFKPLKIMDIQEKLKDIHSQQLCITFDDGYLDNYQIVFPVLQEFQLNATFFVVTSKINGENYMTWSQLKEMTDHGMEIGSHTVNHCSLATKNENEIQFELEYSKKVLEDRLGKTVSSLSVPHGSYDKRVLTIARNVGYLKCCTSDWGFNTDPSNSKLGRILVKRNTNIIRICQYEKNYILKIHLIHLIKRMVEKTMGTEMYNRLFRVVYSKPKYLSDTLK
jgi:peptidoglycan/xylan/chitin deacetylase (PgdA/CDA1 family)